MKRAKLFTPGPTEVPPEVLETQARPLVHHRSDAFRKAHLEVIEGLRYILRTEGPVVLLASSGTGAMEAAVVNLTRPGDKALVTVNGKFSERWAEITRTYGVKTVVVEAEWGESVAPEAIERAFEVNPGVSVFFTTHSETSTGVLQDVERLARVAHDHDALVIVDGISSVCAHDVRVDEWGIDCMVGGAQKGVMTPPGLSFLSLSPQAVRKMTAGRHPCYYFDLLAATRTAEKGDTPYTPAITLVFALQRALQMIREEGIEKVIARHAANARAVRAAVRALGLGLFASVPSNATTAAVPPPDKAAAIVRTMEERYGVKITGGQGKLKGKIIRLGHLGWYDRDDMVILISALEAALVDLEIVPGLGAGLEALGKAYRQSTP